MLSEEYKTKRAKEERKARHKAFLVELQERLRATSLRHQEVASIVGWVGRKVWHLDG